MKITLLIGIVITVSATDLWVQAIGILITGVSIFVIDSRCWK